MPGQPRLLDSSSGYQTSPPNGSTGAAPLAYPNYDYNYYMYNQGVAAAQGAFSGRAPTPELRALTPAPSSTPVPASTPEYVPWTGTPATTPFTSPSRHTAAVSSPPSVQRDVRVGRSGYRLYEAYESAVRDHRTVEWERR